MVCDVSNGMAGCRDTAALACDNYWESHCDGNEVVSCCACGALNWWNHVPCVPGYETRADCESQNLSCIQTWMDFAECNAL